MWVPAWTLPPSPGPGGARAALSRGSGGRGLRAPPCTCAREETGERRFSSSNDTAPPPLPPHCLPGLARRGRKVAGRARAGEQGEGGRGRERERRCVSFQPPPSPGLLSFFQNSELLRPLAPPPPPPHLKKIEMADPPPRVGPVRGLRLPARPDHRPPAGAGGGPGPGGQPGTVRGVCVGGGGGWRSGRSSRPLPALDAHHTPLRLAHPHPAPPLRATALPLTHTHTQ